MIVEVCCEKNLRVESPPREIRISTYATTDPTKLESGDEGICLDLRCPLVRICSQKGVFRSSTGNSECYGVLDFLPNDI